MTKAGPEPAFLIAIILFNNQPAQRATPNAFPKERELQLIVNCQTKQGNVQKP